MNATSTLLAQILTSVVNECLLAAERRKTPLTWSLPSSKLVWRNLLKLESIGIFLIPLVLYQKFSLLYFHSNTNQSKFKRIGCSHLNSVCLVLKITLASRERAESSGTCCTVLVCLWLNSGRTGEHCVLMGYTIVQTGKLRKDLCHCSKNCFPLLVHTNL